MKVLVLFCIIVVSGFAAGGNITNKQHCSSLSKDGCFTANIKTMCRETLEAYPLFRDQLMYQEYGALFTKAARFQIGNNAPVVGRERIVEALQERGPKLRTRHLAKITSMRIADGANIEAISYVNVYKLEDQQVSLAPWIIGEYHDLLTIKNGRCLIENRLVKVVSRVD